MSRQLPSENQETIMPRQMEGNRFPDCVFIKLHHIPNTEAIKSSPIQLPASMLISRSVDVQLTIRFGQQKIQVPGGVVWFGLKRGELRLTILNGSMPIETMGLTQDFSIYLDITEQQDKTSEAEVHATIASGVKQKNINKTTSQTTRRVYQVSTRGTEEQPIWVFAVKTQEPILMGQLVEVGLGKVCIVENPCQLQTNFVVSKEDIQLTEASGLLLPNDIGRNKTALIERAFCLRYILPKLQPHLSSLKEVL